MLILSLCQALFGIAALSACGSACAAITRRNALASRRVVFAGALSLAFFLTVPNVAPQLPIAAVLAIAVGIVIAPRHELPEMPSLVDDIDVGDSTATRRLRRK